jgi:hypothetical protein
MSVTGVVGRLPDAERTGKALAALRALIQGKRPRPTVDSTAVDVSTPVPKTPGRSRS